jgi:hypothetical protein
VASCIEQFWADIAACDAQWSADKAACNGDPSCLQQAIYRRQACEDVAYHEYNRCIGSGSGAAYVKSPSMKPHTEDGAPDCGCG